MAYDQMTADLLRENEALRAEIERLRMQLVACDAVAMANTRETAGEAREMHPDYWSASAQSVALAVDREMSHREEVERQAQEIAALRADDFQLRSLLAGRVAPTTLYRDDGELSDNSAWPHIDFKRDSARDIHDKLAARCLAAIDAAMEASNAG